MNDRTRKHRRALLAMVPRMPSMLSRILERANTHKRVMPDWRVRQLKRFGEQLSLGGIDLERARRSKRTTVVAWTVRNLLELWIWVQFCCVSEDNAKRFRDDSQRDFYGLMKAFEGLIRGDSLIDEADFTRVFEDLRALAKTHGIVSLGDDFKRVSEAASELGHKELFLLNNKLLSKLAHPTAFVVARVGTMKVETEVRDMLFVDGTKWIIDSTRCVNNLIATVLHDGKPKPSDPVMSPPWFQLW